MTKKEDRGRRKLRSVLLLFEEEKMDKINTCKLRKRSARKQLTKRFAAIFRRRKK